MFSSLDKINDHVSAVEKSFASKLKTLEIENSRLRDQVISLNKKLNSEIMTTGYNNIIETKPMTEVFSPIESDPVSVNIIDTDLPVDKTENIINKSLGFDDEIYNSGMISYNNEEYDKCIQYLIHLNKLSELGIAKYSDLVLIKQGMIYRNIGMNNKAQERFKSLVNIYPDSEYVNLAQAEINNI